MKSLSLLIQAFCTSTLKKKMSKILWQWPIVFHYSIYNQSYSFLLLCVVYQPSPRNHVIILMLILSFSSKTLLTYLMVPHLELKCRWFAPENIAIILVIVVKNNYVSKNNYISNKENAHLRKTAPELSKSTQAADQFGSFIFRSVHKHSVADKNNIWLWYILDR